MTKSKDFIAAYIFIVPALLYMLVFVGYPIIENIRLSFLDVNVMTVTRDVQPFVGFENYKILHQKGVIVTALKNTLIYTIACLVFQFMIGLAFALLFSRSFRLAPQLRGLVMISWLLPPTVTAMVFKFMFSTNGGIVNEIIKLLAPWAEPVEWLLTPFTAMLALVIANTWIGVPFNMILLTAGLTTIPKDIYESASIDGANAVKRFFYITLPLLKPAIYSLLMLGFIYTFKVFDLVIIMTKGGPVNATQMMSTYAYKLSFDEFNFSQGAAASNIMFLVMLIVAFLYLRMVYREEVSGS